MTYVREEGMTAARRRRRKRAVLTLTAVAAFVIVSFLIAIAYNNGWLGAKPTEPPTPTCTPTPIAAPKDIPVVNVYNSTDRNGIAAGAAKVLQNQGFKTGQVINDPLKKKIPGVAEIRYGQQGASGAQAVLLRMPGAKLVLDKRQDASVDLVLGQAFRNTVRPTAIPTAAGC